MGTRADFYVESKKGLEYRGSIGWDGFPESIESSILYARTADEFKNRLSDFLKSRRDASLPSQDGWPWPWDDSNTTDYAYIYRKGKVYVSHFGSPLVSALDCSMLRNRISYCTSLKRIDDLELVSVSLNKALTALHEKLEDRLEVFMKSGKEIEFPDMTKIQKVSLGENSGLIVIG